MKAAGMLVRDIGVGALDTAGEVCTDEQVQDPVDAVGGNPAPLRLGYGFGDIVGAGRLLKACQRVEHRRAHLRPLLADAGQSLARRSLERFALMKLVIVSGHGRN